MKRILALLFVSSTCYGTDTLPKPKVTTSAVIDAAPKHMDSANPSLVDTTRFIVPAKSDTGTSIYVIKEASKNNLFKDVLPILTLLLGIGINKFLDWLKDKKKITKVGERWVAEIRGLESPISQQIDLLQKSFEEGPEKQYRFADLPIVSTLDCEIFKSLDKSELLKFIERHKKDNYREAVTISNQTHGFISILVRLHDTLQEKYTDFINGISKHITTTNEKLQELSRDFAHYGVALEKELGKDPLNDARYRPVLDLFNKYIEPHRKDGAFDLFELDDLFFEPLTHIFATLRHDERTKAMADATLGFVNGIKGIRMEKHYWAENTKSIIELYKEQLNALPTIANNIENRPS